MVFRVSHLPIESARVYSRGLQVWTIHGLDPIEIIIDFRFQDPCR